MGSTACKLVTIITEAALESTLVADLANWGAPGYTIADVRGKGARGVRVGEWDLDSNIRCDVLCDPVVADRIATNVNEKYGRDFALLVMVSDVVAHHPSKT